MESFYMSGYLYFTGTVSQRNCACSYTKKHSHPNMQNDQ